LHKWFVLLAGLKTGAPIWRLIIHDWSKFTPAEWGPYVRHFYDKDRERPGELDAAWLHHWSHNPHHWQFWAARNGLESRTVLESYAREMVADWMGAGRAITGRCEVAEWYEKNVDKMTLHPWTRKLVERLIAECS